jgi:hypothetical protein
MARVFPPPAAKPPITTQQYTSSTCYASMPTQVYTASCMHLMNPPQLEKPIEVPIKRATPASMNSMSFWR